MNLLVIPVARIVKRQYLVFEKPAVKERDLFFLRPLTHVVYCFSVEERLQEVLIVLSAFQVVKFRMLAGIPSKSLD